MTKKRFSTKSLTLLAVLVAVQVILTKILSIQTPFVRISFAFIPLVMMGILFGPWLAALGAGIGDVIGGVIFAGAGPYFPGFTLTAIVTGIIYGLFYYRKKITLPRIAMATVLVAVICHLGLNSLWLKIIMDKAFFGYFWVRVGQNCVTIIVEVIIVSLLVNLPQFQKLIQKVQK